MCCRGQNYALVNKSDVVKIHRHYDPTSDVESTLKITVIGDSGVGKTKLLDRLVDNEYSSHNIPTIGIEFKTFFLDVDDRSFKIMMWDTAGQERFRTITRSYYRASHVALLVFDLTKQISFDNMKHWRAEIVNHAPEAIIIVVGCKLDLVQPFGAHTHEKSNLLTAMERVDISELEHIMEVTSTYVEVSSKGNVGFKELRKSLAAAARIIMKREMDNAYKREIKNRNIF